MTQFDDLTLELPHPLHDYVEVELTDVKVDMTYAMEECHGVHFFTTPDVEYSIKSSKSTSTGENVELSKEEIDELEGMLIDDVAEM